MVGGASALRADAALAVEGQAGIGPAHSRGGPALRGKAVEPAGRALGVTVLEGGGLRHAAVLHPAQPAQVGEVDHERMVTAGRALVGGALLVLSGQLFDPVGIEGALLTAGLAFLFPRSPVEGSGLDQGSLVLIEDVDLGRADNGVYQGRAVRPFSQEKVLDELAAAAGYDVRTVRKQLEVGRQEREGREARATVLRQALEKHYADLVAFADRLNASIVGATLPMGARGDRMWSALHEHMPRSPLWKEIDKMERLNKEIASIQDRAWQRMQQEALKRSPVGFAPEAGATGLYRNPMEAALGQLLKPINPDILEFQTQETRKGLVEIRYGGYLIATVSGEEVSETQRFLAALKSEVTGWPEREDMARMLASRSRGIREIEEELATVILRRVVPGRCKYCPV